VEVPVVPMRVSVEVVVPGAFGQYCRLIPQLWPGANEALEQVFAGMLKMPLLEVSETKGDHGTVVVVLRRLLRGALEERAGRFGA
jgi:hypothetical protein